jgi:hypothetical protein
LDRGQLACSTVAIWRRSGEATLSSRPHGAYFETARSIRKARSPAGRRQAETPAVDRIASSPRPGGALAALPPLQYGGCHTLVPARYVLAISASAASVRR